MSDEARDWWPAEARRVRMRNLRRAPFVLLIRAPVLTVLWLFSLPGRGCYALALWLANSTPGFEYLPSDPKKGKR